MRVEAQVRAPISIASSSSAATSARRCPTEEACGIRSPKRYFTAQAKYTGDADAASCSSKRGWSENDETYSTNEAQASVQADATSAGPIATTTERWSSVDRPVLLPRAGPPHRTSAHVSYVTGTHAVRPACSSGTGGNRHQRSINGGVDLYQEYQTVNGVRRRCRSSSTTRRSGRRSGSSTTSASIVQDSWTLQAADAQPGHPLRAVQHLRARRRSSPAGGSCRCAQFDKIENLPNWRDVAPRLGGVYDVFGRRQDGAQGARRQIHAGVLDRRLRRSLQPDGASQTDRRTWARSQRRRHRAGQRDRPGRSRRSIPAACSNRMPDPDIRRPYQWEYEPRHPARTGHAASRCRPTGCGATSTGCSGPTTSWCLPSDYTIVQHPEPAEPVGD